MADADAHSNASSSKEMHKLTFEVFGKVQGVFFRKHTHAKATQLKLVGYCANTKSGSVIGEAVGPKDKIQQFQKWLRHEGSPNSKIEDAKFTVAEAGEHPHTCFEVRRHDGSIKPV